MTATTPKTLRYIAPGATFTYKGVRFTRLTDDAAPLFSYEPYRIRVHGNNDLGIADTTFHQGRLWFTVRGFSPEPVHG